MSEIMERMTSKEYKLLLQMYRVQAEMPDGRKYVPVSQRELSDILGLSPVTVNSYYKYFAESGLIEPFGDKKSRYSLTEKAISLLDSFENARKVEE